MTDQETQLRGGIFTATSTAAANIPIIDRCCTAPCGPTKRRSPSSSSSQEPLPKKLNLHGFTKLPIIPSSSIQPPPNTHSPENTKIDVPTPSPATQSPASPSSSDATPSPKVTDSRVNRMKQIIREMSQWCDEFIGEDELEENHNNPNTEESGEIEKKTEESVSVDRTGDGGFMINFNCPCGKDYQILLSKSKIYYKL
ncbi:hypothetical protein LguiB_026040 [Lonicera macranthoides]